MKRSIRFAKGLGVILAACILFMIVVINFGAAESRLVCSGMIQRQVNGGDPVTTRANWLVMAIGSDLEQWRSRAKSFETLWRASSCDGKREIAPQLLPAFGNHR